MTTKIQSIQTSYKGRRFRSRLEARWAIVFDTLGLDWEYEPEGFVTSLGPYLPDFFIHGNRHYGPYVEIKGTEPTRAEIAKLEEVCLSKCSYGVIVWGDVGSGNYIYIHKEAGAYFDENPLVDAFIGANRAAWPEAVAAARAARFEHGETP